MKAGRRLGSWVFGVVIVAALPAFGSTNVAAARTAAPATRSAPSTHSSHTSPFFPLTANHRGVAGSRTLKRGGSVPVSRLARGSAGAGLRVGGGAAAALPHSPRTAPLVGSTTPNTLVSFPGTAQETAISAFGNDQQVTPPNEDVAASPSEVVEVVNSTIYVFSRYGTGTPVGADLNVFMNVLSGFHSSDPRVIYDASAGRFWVTVTEVPPSSGPFLGDIFLTVMPSFWTRGGKVPWEVM